MENNWIENLREAVNIVDIVGEYVSLRPKGHRHWACCPFHNEKTPSFEVDERSQLFYCFGCHKGGNVYTFVMEMEHMEFIDAARLLAERVNFDIPEYAGDAPTITAQQRLRIYECNRAAALFFHQTLYSDAGGNALAYLHRRGLDDQTIRRFGIGATHPDNGQLLQALGAQGFTDEEIYLAGLSRESETRRRELFFGRAMFPIINAQGRVLGFGGRVMGDGQPKYLNTADTIIFNKRRELYGLNIVKKQGGLKRLILVEGYMDVVSLAQKGVSGVVATLGTALTPEQVDLIARYVPMVYVAYDGDGAGQNAIARALDMFMDKGLPAKVLRFPGGRDPDEFVREFGREAFDNLPAMQPTEWQIDRAQAAHDLATQEGRTQFAIDAMKEVAKLKNPVERESYLPDLEIRTGFSREALMAQMGIAVQSAAQTASNSRNVRPRISREDDFLPEDLKAERLLLLLCANGYCPTDALVADDFSDDFNRRLAKLLIDGRSASSILDELEPEMRDRAVGIFQQDTPISEEMAGQMAADCAEKLRIRRLTAQIAEMKERIAGGGEAERGEVLRHLMILTQELSRLKAGRKE